MQNNILDNNKIVNLTPLTSKKAVSNATVPTELRSVKDHAIASKVVVIKKDGTREDYNFNKIVNAVKKSAGRVMISLSDEDFSDLAEYVESELANLGSREVNIAQMHDIVESALEDVSPKIARRRISFICLTKFIKKAKKLCTSVIKKIQTPILLLCLQNVH